MGMMALLAVVRRFLQRHMAGARLARGEVILKENHVHISLDGAGEIGTDETAKLTVHENIKQKVYVLKDLGGEAKNVGKDTPKDFQER